MATTADTLAASADAAYTDAKTLANNALTGVTTALTNANQNVAGLGITTGISGTANPDDVVPVVISKPLLPTNDFSTEVKQAFDYAFSSFNGVLQPQIANYLTTFFPDIAAAVKTGSDQWIVDTIASGRYVPAAVENALWNRAKDRESQEAYRTEKEIIDASASRGFSAPPGVLNFALASTQQELTKKLTTISRDIAIKAFDVANENAKFAIQQAVALRTAFVAALGDFIKIAMVQPNGATDYAKTILAAKTGLYDSAIRLYSAQIDEEKMHVSTALENRGQDLKFYDQNMVAYDKYQQIKIRSAEIQANVALQAAEQLAKVAAAAMATRNSVVSVSAGI